MTLNQLHKRLGKLIKEGHGRARACISKETFRDNREGDGVTILPIQGLGIQFINLADGDGFMEINKDGSERMEKTLVLAGEAGANSKGDLVDTRAEWQPQG